MKKRILLNAFHMNCVVHQSPGLWTEPGDRMESYTDLQTWIDLAKLLERGRFDALFLADVVGVYDVFRGNREAAVANAAQIPVNDPALLIPAMASVTRDLGFAWTSSVLQNHPFAFARTVSTLDHLTRGRIAWNIVTSYLESGARNFGRRGLPEHDERYEIAEEYLDICYRLWESSWEDGAVIKDRRRGIYADPKKVHPVDVDGKYYQVHGVHLSEPSPQRTPLLYQAGASPRGRQFAARHAECVFVLGPNPGVVSQYIADTRERARAFGRDPEDLKFFAYLKVITGGTEAEARGKYEGFLENISYDASMALLSGWSGIDFGQFEPDQPLEYIETNAIRTIVHGFTAADPSRKWTLRDLARYVGIGGAGPVLVGAPEQVADELQKWIDVGVDGFNLAYAVTPGSFEDFVDGVVPVLQQRGLTQREYEGGTLREKIYGRGQRRLLARHPAARYAAQARAHGVTPHAERAVAAASAGE
ncbi:MAG: LLM class flavin-dependent oxidoreductase [Myxococcales bacterium]|nr:LLM class flavin-dependent oxidoreductase [Myxococcales bacterium]